MVDDEGRHEIGIVASDASTAKEQDRLRHIKLIEELMADALGRTVIACRENEASSRGAALLALERLGVIGHVRELPARMGRAFEPVAEHRRIYEEDLGRQRRLYTILFEQDG